MPELQKLRKMYPNVNGDVLLGHSHNLMFYTNYQSFTNLKLNKFIIGHHYSSIKLWRVPEVSTNNVFN